MKKQTNLLNKTLHNYFLPTNEGNTTTVKKEEKEKDSQQDNLEDNIFHKCKNCKKVITTEKNVIFNLQNKRDLNLVKPLKKFDFLIFIMKKEEEKNYKDKINYTIDSDKILCKFCKIEVGYLIRNENVGNKKYGFLSIDAIESKKVNYPKIENCDKGNIFTCYEEMSNNESHFKRVRMFIDKMKYLTRSFYKEQVLTFHQVTNDIKDNTTKLESVIKNNEI